MTLAGAPPARRPAGRLAGALVAAALAVGTAAAPAQAALEPPPEPVLTGPVPGVWPAPPEVAAPVHLLVDVATGQVLAAEGADERRPVASTVKVLTALTVADRVELDDEVVVGDEVVGLEGASVDLEPGERWTYEQLLIGLLVRSGNDAAEAAATAVGGSSEAFVELMEDTAEDVGLDVGPTGIVVTAPTGLDDTQRFTARDLATLGRVLLDDPDLRRIVALERVALPGVEEDENRNLLVGSYPGATGIKTGFTEASGNSLVASARRGDRELIAVVLGGGPDPERFTDATALLDHGFEAFEDREVAGELTLLVAGGTRTLTAGPVELVLPTGADATVDLPVPVRAPEPGDLAVPLLIGGREVVELAAEVSGEVAPASTAGGQLGRAVADGVYAALRATGPERPVG